MPIVDTVDPPPFVMPNTAGFTTITLGSGVGNYTTDTQTLNLSNSTNYLIKGPVGRAHFGTVTINPGDNSIIVLQGIYKTIGLTNAGLDPSPGISTTGQDSGATNFRFNDGLNTTIFCVGIHIDGSMGPISPLWNYPVEQDGFSIKSPNVIFWFKDCRVENLIGGLNPPHKHADVMQPFGGAKEIHLEDFYGRSHYNNLYFRRENNPLDWPVGKLFLNRVEMDSFDTNPSDTPSGGTNTTPGGTPSTLRALSIGTQPTPNAGDNSDPLNAVNPTAVWAKNFYANPPTGRALNAFMHPINTGYAPSRGVVSADGTYAYWPLFDDLTAPPDPESDPPTSATDGTNSGDAKMYGVIKKGHPPEGNYVPADKVGLNFTAPFQINSGPTLTSVTIDTEDYDFIVFPHDPDGDTINASTMTVSVDGGAAQTMQAGPGSGQYHLNLHLSGVAGDTLDHNLHFEVDDINSAGALTGTLDVVVTVALPEVTPPPVDTSSGSGGVVLPGPTPKSVAWTVVHYDHQGNQVADYEPADLSFGTYDSQPGYFNGILHLQSPFATKKFAQPHVHDWVIFRNETPLLGGILTGVQVDSDSRMLTIAGNTWDIYFQNLVMPYDQDNPVNKHYYDKDLFAITEGIASYILGANAPNSLNITMSNGLSGINVSAQHFIAAELNTLDDIIHSLGDQTPGFDYEVTWDKRLILYTPQKGSQKDFTLSLGDEGITQWHYELSGVRGTQVYGRGTPAAATSQIVVDKQNSNASATFRHRDVITDFSTVKNEQQLSRLVAADLVDSTKQVYNFIITMQNPASTIYSDISWGDSIMVNADGLLDYENFTKRYFRIQSVEGYVNDRGTEKVVVTMGQDQNAN